MAYATECYHERQDSIHPTNHTDEETVCVICGDHYAIDSLCDTCYAEVGIGVHCIGSIE